MHMDFSRADQVVRMGLADGAYTAACLLVGHGEKVLFRRAYGRIGLEDDSLPVNEQTLFDLDSLTKPIVTGLLALRALAAALAAFGFSPFPAPAVPFLTSSTPDLCSQLFLVGLLCGISGLSDADLAEDAHLAMLAK